MKGGPAVPVSRTFEQFTSELADRMQMAQDLGMSAQDIAKRAQDVGDWLAGHVDPKSAEQRVLKELWTVADQQEQHALANCMMKMVQRHQG